MYHLHLLGRIELLDQEGRAVRAVLAQPKRLALLAYLAVKTTNGSCRRDELLALFWGDLTEERARNALNKSIHFLRQSIGDSVTSRGTEELTVDASLLSRDTELFHARWSAAGTPKQWRLIAAI